MKQLLSSVLGLVIHYMCSALWRCSQLANPLRPLQLGWVPCLGFGLAVNMLALDLDCLVAVLPWIWFAFLGFFGFLRDVSFGFGLLLDFLDWVGIFFWIGLDWQSKGRAWQGVLVTPIHTGTASHWRRPTVTAQPQEGVIGCYKTPCLLSPRFM